MKNHSAFDPRNCGCQMLGELIRKDEDRLQLRALLLAGAASVAAEPVSDAYFEGLRQKVRSAGKARGGS